MADNKSQKIPPQGSLALLAYGAEGLRAWRKAREQFLAVKKSELGKS